LPFILVNRIDKILWTVAGTAGKTTLLSTLKSIYTRKRDQLRNPAQLIKSQYPASRTRGIEVRSIAKDGIRLSLWDMAGQAEFHAFHDCMFPDIAATAGGL
jgi:GTPase SAR1 family protein